MVRFACFVLLAAISSSAALRRREACENEECDSVCNGMAELCDLQYDQVTFAGSHNAGSGFDGDLVLPSREVASPCLFRNHFLNMTGQLDVGIRVFEFDTCYVEECTESLCPQGVWTCHSDGFAGQLQKAFLQIDEWMKAHPTEVCAIAINDCYPSEYQTEITEGLHALLMTLWEPTPARVSSGELSMNTERGSTGKWPTLLEAIESNQRIFVFVEPELQKQNELWYNILPTSTYGSSRFNSKSTCFELVFYARERCNVCEEMVKVNVFGSFGLCISEMQQRCNLQIYNATDACYTQRREYGRTVNWIMVDYPGEAVEPNTATETARRFNLMNVEFFLPSAPPTSQPPEDSCIRSRERPDIPTLPPPTTTCEAIEQIPSNLAGLLNCTANPVRCTELTCTVDLFGRGPPFRADVVLLQCNDPPAVNMKVFLPTGQLFLEETINKTDTIAVFGLEAEVKLDHYEEAVGIQIDYLDDGGATTLIPYTLIPLDYSECSLKESRGEHAILSFTAILFPAVLTMQGYRLWP